MSFKSVTLASRIAQILEKLNTGAIISVNDLANEFSVSKRTIQKDLNERLDPNLLDYLGSGKYRLVSGYLGKITIDDIKDFSKISGIIDLYPNLDDIIKHKIRDSLIVNSTVNRGCIPSSKDFTEINSSIEEFKILKFDYNGKKIDVEPYKLLNHKGIWYLLARSSGVIKSYCLHKMKRVRKDICGFLVDKALLGTIEKNPSPWFRQSKIDVRLEVDSSFSEYFIDRNILPNRERVFKNLDGSLLIDLSVNSIEEIKGTIKFWIPKIRVIKPKYLLDDIKKDIKDYL